MRPGQLRPGDIRAADDGPGWRPGTASMRPGQLRPGDGPVASPIQGVFVRFNEAGAASPRRCRRSRTLSGCFWPGFNEAGAASPRRSGAALMDGDDSTSLQ